MNCTEFQKELPDLILTPDSKPSLAAVAHLKDCPPCTEEYASFRRTFAVLDGWTAPAPSPYFDQKMQVRMREEQSAARMGWFEALMTRLQLNTSHRLKPAMAGALALVLVVGGGSFAGLTFSGSHAKADQASATVTDLQILDRNEQALDQLDQFLQDGDGPSDDSTTSAQPTT